MAESAVQGDESQVGAEVVGDGDGVDDEVETVSGGGHALSVGGHDQVMGTEALGVVGLSG